MIPMRTITRRRQERGAIIIHVAFALLMLIAFSAFVVDMGVMWVSRRQAQNAADAGALAGAVALMRDGNSSTEAAKSALQWTNNNPIFGMTNSAANVRITFSGPSGTCGPSCDVTTIPPCLPDKPGCVRVDVFRNTPDRAYRGGATLGAPVQTFFAPMVGITQQGVRATATAEVASGNTVKCMLPFAVIDRWADNYDPTPVTTYFPNDALPGTAGWTPNDFYQPTASPADVYIPPYGGNTNHTGWKVTSDYGRQLILKDGSVGNYSTGWSQMVCLNGPANCSGNDIKTWLETCNPQAVGIATAPDACTVGDEPHGCIDIKTGVAQGPVSQGVTTVVNQDAAAVWNPTADGPNGPGTGAVTGGQGMSSPRIRGMVVLDINHYAASGCTGGTCVGKVANIIGFFVQGICNTVTLDPGLTCDDPNKDIVGRIVTLPAQYVSGTGDVEDDASFIKVVRLVR
jgi:Putative Flp pilus-assembly TadE/G-like